MFLHIFLSGVAFTNRLTGFCFILYLTTNAKMSAYLLLIAISTANVQREFRSLDLKVQTFTDKTSHFTPTEPNHPHFHYFPNVVKNILLGKLFSPPLERQLLRQTFLITIIFISSINCQSLSCLLPTLLSSIS